MKDGGNQQHVPQGLDRETSTPRAAAGRTEPLHYFAENDTDILYRYRLAPTPGFEYISPSVTAVTGYTPADYYADACLINRLVHPEDVPVLEAAIGGYLSATPTALTLRWVRKDGAVIWTEQRPRFVLDPNGDPVAMEGIVRDVTAQKRIEAERDALLARQTRIAEELQRSLLVLTPPSALPGIVVEAVYEPASDDTLIGGDFQDTFLLEEHRVALIVGDVSGKGLDAAIHTAEVKFALRVLLREDPDPAAALTRLNRFVRDARRFDAPRLGAAYIAAAVAVLDTQTGALVCSAAGIEPPFLLRDGDAPVTVLSAGGPVLGVFEGAEYDAQAAILGPRDRLVMFTDGLVEARKDGLPFGYDGLVATLREEIAREEPDAPVGRAAVERSRAFAGGLRQDDVCLLLVRRLPDHVHSPQGSSGREWPMSPPVDSLPTPSPRQPFAERLRALHEVSMALSRAVTTDAFCRAVVALGRERLGYDRLSLWLIGADPNTLVGSFGTDEQGQTRDERAQSFPSNQANRQASFAGRAVSIYPDWPLSDARTNAVGRGWLVAAAVRDGEEVIGILNADNLLYRRPLEDDQAELLGLYGAVVGHLYRRLQMEQSLRAAETRQRSFLRDVLYSVTEGRLCLADTPADLPVPPPSVGTPQTLSLGALSTVRERLRDTALAHGLTEENASDLVTAAGECLINALQHGGGDATVRLYAEAGRVQVWIEDHGRGIPVSDLPRATLLKGHSGGDSFGHGFFMMLRTADVIHLLTGTSGTTVVIEQITRHASAP